MVSLVLIKTTSEDVNDIPIAFGQLIVNRDDGTTYFDTLECRRIRLTSSNTSIGLLLFAQPNGFATVQMLVVEDGVIRLGNGHVNDVYIMLTREASGDIRVRYADVIMLARKDNPFNHVEIS